MSKNLKTLICCVLALVFVAGTIVAVFADSTGASTREAESVTGEVEESTGLVDEPTSEDADETTTVVDEPTSEDVDETTTVVDEPTSEDADETTTVADVDDETTTVPAVDDETTTVVDEPASEDVSEVVSEEESSEENYGKLGDVDGNGKIEAVDARLALRCAATLEKLNKYEMWRADVIKDNVVVAADARIILRVTARLESESYLGSQQALDDYNKSISETPSEVVSVKEEGSSVA